MASLENCFSCNAPQESVTNNSVLFSKHLVFEFASGFSFTITVWVEVLKALLQIPCQINQLHDSHFFLNFLQRFKVVVKIESCS